VEALGRVDDLEGTFVGLRRWDGSSTGRGRSRPPDTLDVRGDGSFARLPTVTDTQIPRPTSGDVVEVILDDHRLFESLLRDLRDGIAARLRAEGVPSLAALRSAQRAGTPA